MNNLELLKVYNYDNKIRLGEKSDGGYVIAELDEPLYDCYISAGISNEESFTRDFLQKYCLDKNDCYGFDGTISDYPYNYTNNITFIKKNINYYNDDENTNLSYLLNKYNNIFLKIDIEGGEYPWLLSIEEQQLKKFKQIVIEFHGITGNSWNCNYKNKVSCLKKLSETHFIVHAHGNNYGPTKQNIPDVIELTYVNKDYFKDFPELNTKKLPTPMLDYPNNLSQKDIDINFYPFVYATI